MKLTDAVIKSKSKALMALAKETGKPQKLADGGELYLLFTPAGGRSWNWKYRVDGKEKRMTFGLYPEVTLAQAREKHQATRKQLADGVDPGEARKADARELLATYFGPGGSWRFAGVIEAFAVQFPEQFGYELFDVLPKDAIENPSLANAFVVIDHAAASHVQRLDVVLGSMVFGEQSAAGFHRSPPGQWVA